MKSESQTQLILFQQLGSKCHNIIDELSQHPYFLGLLSKEQPLHLFLTKVIKTAQHPYLIEHNIGWANNKVIEDAQKPSIHFHVGELVRFDGLWTASDGGIWYSKDQLLIKSGRITKVIKGAKHPFLINNGLGWASAAVLHHI